MHFVIGDECFPAAPMQRFDCSRPGRVNFSRANLNDFTQNMTKCTLTKMGIKFVEHDMHEDSKKRQNVYSNYLYSKYGNIFIALLVWKIDQKISKILV